MTDLRTVFITIITSFMVASVAQVHATTPDDFSRLSEAAVLERYGRLDVSDTALAVLAEELAATQPQNLRGGGAIRYVGPGCPFATIQSAVSASSDGDTVRVVTDTYSDAVSISFKGLNLVGGFSSCTATTPSGRSTINRGGSGLGVDIFYPAAAGDPLRTVNIENFRISGGGGSGFSSGGVIVEGRPGRLSVNFRNVEISANSRDGAGENGGGMRIIATDMNAGTSPMVTFDNDSALLNNSAGGDGGAIHCQSSFDTGAVTMLRLGSTLVFQNEAENGGGLAVKGCSNVFLYSGGPVVLFFPAGGFVGNTALEEGGGIWVSSGGSVQLRAIEFAGFGDGEEAALLAGNTAARGGAAAVVDANSELRVEDAYTINNNASQGAGLYARSGGRLEVARQSGTGACAPVQTGGGLLSRPPCSVIDGNDASAGGGALNLSGEAEGDVSRTIIRNNTAGGALGPIARLNNSSLYEGPLTQLRIEGSLIYDNSGGFGLNAVNNAEIIVSHSTIADNPITEFRAAAAADRFAAVRVFSSIVEGGIAMGFNSGDGTTVIEYDCVIGNLAQVDNGATVNFGYSQIDPEFVDAANRDYRPGATSPAIDYCDDSLPPAFPGLDGNPRGVAWNGPPTNPAPNPVPGGLFDLGAYELPFEPLSADLALDTDPPGQQALFINNGDSIAIGMTLSNNGPNTAFGPIDVIDDFTAGAVSNESWQCLPPAGVSCTPASGTGDIQTEISGLEPGQQLELTRSADLAQPGTDQNFDYIIVATESLFNIDLSAANNTLQLELETGLFADEFE